MLTRLVEKGVVNVEKKPDAVTEFSAALPRQDFVKAESHSFLKRVFQGAEGALLLHFAENSRLTADEAQNLKRLFDEVSKRKP
jgi:BlaI family penicillinase repressor